MARTIYIVDDENLIRKGLVGNLQAEDYQTLGFADAESAIAALGHDLPSIVVLDIKLPGMDGVAALGEFLAFDPAPLVIMITAFSTISTAVETMQMGAFHFLPKPVRFSDLLTIIHLAEDSIDRRITATSQQEPGSANGFGAIIHASQSISREIEKCRKLVQSGATTVLITGPSGTGKELFARALHYESDRKSKPFIELNCMAIPEHLFESELFGHLAGAFTDAKRARRGLLELADGGSFFLDEISDMPLNLQGKLLKVIEEKEFYVLGREKSTKVDIRFIASSNRELSILIEQGKFREDLFYRLNVINIHLQGLNSRREDIIPLARHFVAEMNIDLKKEVTEISPAAENLLSQADWPGNVRQLRNVIERVMLLKAENVITEAHVASEVERKPDQDQVKQGAPEILTSLDNLEEGHIAKVLAYTKQHKGDAAQILGIDRKTLYRKMKKYGMSSDQDGAD